MNFFSNEQQQIILQSWSNFNETLNIEDKIAKVQQYIRETEPVDPELQKVVLLLFPDVHSALLYALDKKIKEVESELSQS